MRKVEFLIVGQGLAGTMLAFEMLKNGIDFRIVSSSEKSKASNVAAGMVNPLVFKRLTKSWMVDDLLPVMKNTFSSLESILGKKYYVGKDILKPLSEQEEQLWQERKSNPDFGKYILSIDNTSPQPQIANCPAYGRVGKAGFLNVKLFINAAYSFFKKKNLIVNATLDYKQVDPHASAFGIGNVIASKIIFCEGFHIYQNPFFQFVKMNPTKGEVLLIHALKLSEEYILNKKVFILPVGNQRFKVGSTYNWKDLSEATTTEGRLSIVDRLEQLISAKYTIEEHWAGIRPTVFDRRPILGYHPEFENLSIFNGLGTKGVMLAPFFAREMLGLLTSKDYAVVNEVDVSRFL